MNLKKTIVSLITIIMLVIFMGMQSATYATILSDDKKVYFGINELMEKNTPHTGYAIGNPNENQPGNRVAAKIWNIIKYDSATATTYEDVNMYCVKAEVGFTEADDGGRRKAAYNVFYDMKTQKEEIKKQNEILKQLVEGTITEEGTTISIYNAILAVLDRIYVPGTSSEENETKKKELINTLIQEAKKPESNFNYAIEAMAQAFDENYDIYEPNLAQTNLTEFALTDNDICAVQQAVLWYFTNYYKRDTSVMDSYKELTEHETKFDKLGKTSWLHYTFNKNDYATMGTYRPNGLQEQYDVGAIRNYQAEALYEYMITQAKANASQYENVSILTGTPVQVDTDTLNHEIAGDNFIIGPIHMTQLNNNDYSVNLVVKNNETSITNYKLLNENKEEVKSGTTVKDLVGKDFYLSIPQAQVENVTLDFTIQYAEKTMKLWASTTNSQEQPLVEVLPKNAEAKKVLSFRNEPEPKVFDLSLRKYITKVNGVELTGEETRVPTIDTNTLQNGTTATYKHKKDPVPVNKNDKVTYKMTIYNEGEKAGRATKVVDQLPTGLQFSKVISGNFEVASYDETNNTLNLARKSGNTTNLPAYTSNHTLQEETIEIECIVTATPDQTKDKILTNVAWIAEEYDAEEEQTITTEQGADRDSEPATKPSVNKDNMENYKGNDQNKDSLNDRNYHYKGKQDDDDFEKLKILPETFDLKLIKRITAVNDQEEEEKKKNIDASKLNTKDENGKLITTADYDLNKEPVPVKKGDIVTYTFRIYNEGTIDGYAQEISEDIPEGLEFIWSEEEGDELEQNTTLTQEEKEAVKFNQKYLWGNFQYDEQKEKIITISSDYLSKENETTVEGNLIKAFGRNEEGNKTDKDLSYKEIAVKLKVVSENVTGTIIKNEAAITEDANKEGEPVDDRDSHPEDWKEHPNHEDDEDHDYIILQSFDLSLRKFIIAVSDNTKVEEQDYLKKEDGSYTRAPIVDTSKLNTLDENNQLITTAIYNHTKEPIMVKPNDIVIYMLRVYNEGDINGYAAEIKDHLPPYLEFVEDEFNKQYGWEVSSDGRTVTTKYLENSLINKIQTDEEGKITLSYKEVPIMCKVSENAKTSQNITNIADITIYLDENKKPTIDRDSQKDNVKLPEDKDLPTYKDNEKGDYIPGQQDDDDYEKVVVKIFDLALRKWVTQAIVIENGKETVTQTGHDAWDDPEAVVKVELHRKKLNQVAVKFRYSIRVYNQGEVAGYAKEVTDYIPEGLKFVAEENPGWTDEGNNVISTKLLENTLLQPGEYADVEVLLTWINSENNMGVMNNIAEISIDDNEYDLPDIDSTPDNQKPGEDDIDDAPVMLSVSTGQIRIYFTLGFVVLITIASGVILIKKFVL